MKQKLLHSSAISVLMLAGFAVSASAEEIPLFDATVITASSEAENSPFTGSEVDISESFVYDSADTTVYCAGEGTAYLRTVDDDDNYLIVDNYVTLNEADTESICTGGG
ncbi:MAG: hypothetical protein KGY48_12050, partial [Wenzhouxiangellaceae bacterium]|nr:hypothetical protein [Wenzhouxiangellaceae bacterium]